jgi:hypothetical protein
MTVSTDTIGVGVVIGVDEVVEVVELDVVVDEDTVVCRALANRSDGTSFETQFAYSCAGRVLRR